MAGREGAPFSAAARAAERLRGGRGAGGCGRRRDRFGGRPEARLVDLARLDHQRALEFVLLGALDLAVDEAQVVMPDRDDVAVRQRMLLDQLAVDVGAVRAVQVLEEGIVEDVDDQAVMAADRGIVDADVVVRQATDRVPLLGHVVFGQDLAIQTQDQARHRLPRSRLPEPGQYSVKYAPPRGEKFDHLRQHDRDVVPAAAVVGELHQLPSDGIKITPERTDC